MKILRNGSFNYKYWKSSALATLCGVHVSTIKKWARMGKIPSPARKGKHGVPDLWSEEQKKAIVEFSRSRELRA